MSIIEQPETQTRNIDDDSKNYCVRRHMFFAVTEPIVESNLTKKLADILCKKCNDEELDYMYVWYKVHKIC